MEAKMERKKVIGGIMADAPFWDGLDEGKLTICRCANCKKWIWPAHFRCAACGNYDMEWPEVEAKGTVYAWTRSHVSSDRIMERAGDVPYVVVICELPQAGGARVIGVLKGSEEGLKVDAKVRGEIDPPSEKTKGYSTIRWVLEP